MVSLTKFKKCKQRTESMQDEMLHEMEGLLEEMTFAFLSFYDSGQRSSQLLWVVAPWKCQGERDTFYCNTVKCPCDKLVLLSMLIKSD